MPEHNFVRASGSVTSTVVSTFVDEETAISVHPPGPAASDIWHLLRLGTASTDRIDIYLPEADLRRLHTVLGEALATAPDEDGGDES